jgi:hypothetical protein
MDLRHNLHLLHLAPTHLVSYFPVPVVALCSGGVGVEEARGIASGGVGGLGWRYTEERRGGVRGCTRERERERGRERERERCIKSRYEPLTHLRPHGEGVNRLGFVVAESQGGADGTNEVE